ncbi:hypothetical protein SAMD00019534_041780 [Acytostelium subglobosum LB1]|uniref:hypothetical protein n=1 Tax=Acytostelium subglobosum LB1 TaxID=1410327 RepID=UPI00064501C4|nr:hypothetical protein SAMD00019534_041780 [Acytostelium subglobosum LB1]GAM21003.1 hypothetical protein SAMD00019534_041780 [Acytostelium subglobosum LB1]|eukprot:XP_012756137.1 hypothetical protein SAMD00019534_041780 [Acytostelium subglobosum LB1]
MYNAGQRRLRIPIFHHHGADTGTVMDSSSGNLSTQNRQNLANLLAAIKVAGFQEVEIGFFPMDDNSPMSWDAWNEDRYQENWNFIWNLRPLIAAANIPYRIDLSNEAMPMSTDSQPLKDYCKKLWSDYTWNFGKNDTVGFSMTVWIADRVSQVPVVYSGNPPNTFEFHLYRDSWNGNEYKWLVDGFNKMKSMGLNQPIIIGETFYNDATAAGNIRRAITDTGVNITHVTQWALTSSKKCGDIDVAPPSAYNNFIAKGF